ncbi:MULTISPECIES: helix-turn-helix domain-containing protein [Leeuwenhoekiella]|jgi:AraC-like DNA-binding protein|uniref:helix-turn-helix domain-containing protein n=1 Tax=Leeuwenhoekiella TaxID=283735 RepID=UPI002352CEFB|nr:MULTISPECIES: AraC family transcriptional regulator [Leeuwenhoekiella]
MERGDTERFEQLFQQIYEIASGNFAYRNKLSGRRDHLDTLAELLNMMSEEIASFSYELIPQTPTPANLQILLFDPRYKIKFCSTQFESFLGYDSSKLPKNLKHLLSTETFSILEDELQVLQEHPHRPRSSFYLDFNVPDKRIIRVSCCLRLMQKNNNKAGYLLTLKHQANQEQIKKDPAVESTANRRLRSKSSSNRILTRTVKLYVLQNLNRPLPPLKQIGLLHKTNQTKLKTEFKKAYGTTIHRFHNEKRLEHASMLLKTTEQPIYEIAQQCGYKDLAHFSRMFKEKYNMAPSYYRKSFL